MSQKTDWEAKRQRGNLIRRTLLGASNKEAAIDRLLDMGYSVEEIQTEIVKIQNE